MTLGSIDLGSTQIKVARWSAERAGIEIVARFPAPRPRGRGPIRETNAQAWIEAASEALKIARSKGIRNLGLSVQRSSFAIMRQADGKPISPLISWQDTRAASWCQDNEHKNALILSHTGLPLNAHYVGPKLATLRQAQPDLVSTLEGGGSILGTLETILLYHWSNCGVFVTAPSVAARTLLMNPERGAWDPELLALFRVPSPTLAAILKPADMPLFVAGVHFHAVLSDQAAAFLAIRSLFPDVPIINAGTGTFITIDNHGHPPPGYLRSAVWERLNGPKWCWEGTINAGAKIFPELARASSTASEFAVNDLVSPEYPGLGTPYLGHRNDSNQTRNPVASAIAYAFRIRAILDDFDISPDRAALVSGGCARRLAAVQGLADLLERPLIRLEESELSALGAILQSMDSPPSFSLKSQLVNPRPNIQCRDLYQQWRASLP